MTKIIAIDSTPGEDTPIRSNFIIRMFISLLVLMAFMLLSICLADHCHLSHVFERASEVTDGNYYIYLTKASMSNQLSSELAAEINNASIDQVNQPINNGSSANEPQSNHAQAQVNSNTQFNPGVHNHPNSQLTTQDEVNQNKLAADDIPNNGDKNSQSHATQYPPHNQRSNSIAVNGSNTTPQRMRANSQIEIIKNKKSIPSIDKPAHQNTSKGNQPTIYGGADNNTHSNVDMAQLKNNLTNKLSDEDYNKTELNPQEIINTIHEPTKAEHHPNKCESNRPLTKGGGQYLSSDTNKNKNDTDKHYQPQHHAQSQYNSNKTVGANEFKQTNITPQINHTDDPSIIQGSADNNKEKYATQSNNFITELEAAVSSTSVLTGNDKNNDAKNINKKTKNLKKRKRNQMLSFVVL